MSFWEELRAYKDFDFDGFLRRTSPEDVRRVLGGESRAPLDFLALLAPAAAGCLEEMARRAQDITRRNFGNVILLYTPLYLANHCVNHCRYCSFNAGHRIERRRLSMDEIREEAEAIAGLGFQDLLVLTGESRSVTPISYLEEALGVLKDYFPALGLEIYPLTTDEYRRLIEAGADYLTIYQEVYNPQVYAYMHPRGPKRDYFFRLDAPERAAASGMRGVTIGALLGLDDWRRETFFTGLHAAYLQRKFPQVEVGVSVPRVRPNVGGFIPPVSVDDRELTQIILALRFFLPRAGISVSTRERPWLRDHLLRLGVTRISAASVTAVGGHARPEEGTEQFQPADNRTVEEIKAAIIACGYQPVFKDWHRLW